MKSVITFSAIALIMAANVVSAQGILINHLCTGVEQIPLNVIADIQENVKFQWAHTSHGEQVFCGLELLETQNPTYSVAIGTGAGSYGFGGYLPVEPGALCIFDGVVGYDLPGECCIYITHEGYWMGIGPSFVESTFQYNPTLNVSGWIWCDQLDTCSAAFVQEYLAQMEVFEQLYPDVTFIYTTGNAQANWEEGYNRHLRCNEIRNYCAANNKILFDFEDLDCWYNGQFSYYLYNGDTVPVQHSAYNGDDCGHVNMTSTLQKGKAVWWMMARLQGWQPGAPNSSLQIRAFLEGSYSVVGMSTHLNLKGYIPLAQPFSFPPLNYSGNENVNVIPNGNVVDWILVEMRDAVSASSATAATVIGRKAGFILSNGKIVDLDGSSNLSFDQTVSHDLYVVLWHRNHLGIMSANPLIESNGIYEYDFSTGSSKVYGGAGSHKQLSPGVWGMISGEGYFDGVISQNDKALGWKPQSGKDGYYNGDFNLNGYVNNQDKNSFWVPNLGKSSQVP